MPEMGYYILLVGIITVYLVVSCVSWLKYKFPDRVKRTLFDSLGQDLDKRFTVIIFTDEIPTYLTMGKAVIDCIVVSQFGFYSVTMGVKGSPLNCMVSELGESSEGEYYIKGSTLVIYDEVAEFIDTRRELIYSRDDVERIKNFFVNLQYGATLSLEKRTN